MWPQAAWYNLKGRSLETHGLHFYDYVPSVEQEMGGGAGRRRLLNRALSWRHNYSSQQRQIYMQEQIPEQTK